MLDIYFCFFDGCLLVGSAVRSTKPSASTIPSGAVTLRPSQLTPIPLTNSAVNSSWLCGKAQETQSYMPITRKDDPAGST